MLMVLYNYWNLNAQNYNSSHPPGWKRKSFDKTDIIKETERYIQNLNRGIIDTLSRNSKTKHNVTLITS